MEDQGSDPDEPRPDHPVASSICAIDKKSVHRICSGQVVLTLGTAVKELLENSIDAGATIVDIKLKEYGCELVEVSDNGIGVHPANFEGLTLKHHTSKLRDFGDLINVETFGFRGEALSSLCALCDMSVTTRHKEESVGTKLEFDHNGKITKQEPQARQVGTKVTLQNLFYTLPVRHKEFQRNIKKEFAKMVQVLNSYCIISTGVRITCTNVTAKGSRSTVVSSQGNDLLQENISNVFGPKQVQSLLEFKQKSPNEDVCTEFGLKVDVPSLFKIEGFVSKCEHGQGRSSTDRQFFFINGRPFDSSKLSKVINEVYHQYNRHQYPFVVLKIGVNKDGVDVNVTPDKRQVFVEGEKILLATVKCSLNAMFESTTSFIQLHQPDIVSKLAKSYSEPNTPRLSSESNTPKPNSVVSSLSKLKRSFSSAFAREDSPFIKQRSPSKSSPLPKQRRMDCFMKTDYSPVKDNTPVVTGHSIKLENDTVTNRTLFSETQTTLNGDSGNTETLGETSTTINSNSAITETLSETSTTINGDSVSTVSTGKHSAADHDAIVLDETGDHVTDFIDRSESNSNSAIESNSTSAISNTEKYNSRDLVSESLYSVSRHSINDKDTYTESVCFESDGKTIPEFSVKVHESENRYKLTDSLQENDNDIPDINIAGKEKELLCEFQQKDNGSEHRTDGLLISFHGDTTTNSEIEQQNDNSIDCKDEADDVQKPIKRLNFSLQQFKEKWKLKATKKDSTETFCRSFRAKINPTDNMAAEQELQREIKKESFSQMEILGQFNMGFIITKLGEDLFIVDQHATDEKFNFETLQKDYVIQSQKLICPLNLELTASNETILMDNLDIFRKNGFEFLVDEMGPPTQRVKLTSTPVSKNWNFGKEDIEEMIFMLTDSPGVMCRPSRVRAMFASRACRKSIMIGTVLNKGEMRKPKPAKRDCYRPYDPEQISRALVNHMGEIEQPWNCPHGRPTMRHLINLDMIPK